MMAASQLKPQLIKLLQKLPPMFHRSVTVSARSLSTDLKRKSTQKQITYTFNSLNVSMPGPRGVLQVELNRPDRLNAVNTDMWREIRECFNAISVDPDCRVVILGGLGKHFCAGIDLADLAEFAQIIGGDEDAARKAFRFRHKIREYQDSFTAIEKCPKPVIAAIHGGCIGAGVDMISACDIRYCTEDSFFSIKEVDLGLAADVGTLQRFPKIVGNDSLVREYALTARKFLSSEAKEIGLVSRLFESRETMINLTLNVAKAIAAKSPVAVQGTKVNLNYSRDHSVRDGLENMINWQMAMLQTEDLMKAAMASSDRSGKSVPEFADVV